MSEGSRAGNESCGAREKILDLIKKDCGEAEFTAKDRYFFVNPRKARDGLRVPGQHDDDANFCAANGGRGISKSPSTERPAGRESVYRCRAEMVSVAQNTESC